MKKVNKTALNKVLKGETFPITADNVLIKNARWHVYSVFNNCHLSGEFKLLRGDECFLIDRQDFIELMSMKDLAIQLDGNLIRVASNGINFTYPVELYPDDFPELVSGIPGPNDHWQPFPAEKVASLKNFMSKDELRPAMQGVYMNGELCATNGHILRRYNNELKMQIDYSGFILPALAVNLLDARREYICSFAEFDSRQWIHIQDVVSGIIISTKEINETFPRYESVIPKDNNIFADIDRAELLQFCETVKKRKKDAKKIELVFSENEHQRLKMYFSDDHETVELAKNIQVFLHKTGESQPEPVNLRIGFNPGYIIDCIKGSKKPLVRFNMSTPNRAAIVDESTLIMPVMLNDY